MNKNKKTKKNKSMFWATALTALIALILFVIATKMGGGNNIKGLLSAWNMTIEIMPILIFAFIIAGLLQVILPQDLLSKWLGTESGFKGIIIGTIAGSLTPGGPYVSLPIVAALLKTGAGYGTLVAYLSSWSLWAIARLPMEVGILGWKFTLIRLASVLIFPPITGYIANWIVKILN